MANATAVTALYWNQTLLQEIGASFPSRHVLSLLPMLTLAGYATGVAVIAFGPAARGRSPVLYHLGLLVAALLAAGAAPNGIILAACCCFVGAGAAVAQRSLACAAQLVSPQAAGATIGLVIAGSLLGVLGVRLFGTALGHCVGWRAVFLLAACATSMALLAVALTKAGHTPVATLTNARTGIFGLWRAQPLLRRAAVQQAALFAAYSAGWMLALVQMAPGERSCAVIGGGLAGLAAALAAGRLSDRFGRVDLARAGAAAMLLAAAVLLPVGYATAAGPLRTLLLLLGMVLVDAGLQTALVVNQARVQALDPLMRSRLAATLTVCGSLGGAFGAGSAFWLWRVLDDRAALGVAIAASAAGLLCSRVAGRARPPRPAAATLGINHLGRWSARCSTAPAWPPSPPGCS